MTGLPRSPLRASIWSGLACKVKSGAGVPTGKIFDMEPPFFFGMFPIYCRLQRRVNQFSLDIDPRSQRLVNRTKICDHQELLPLLCRQLANQRNSSLDSVEHCCRLFTVNAVLGVILRMCQDDPNLLEWPPFAVSIHAKGHVRT